MTAREQSGGGLQLVAKGEVCRVYLSDEAMTEYNELQRRAKRNEQNSVKAWRQLQNYMMRFCDHGHRKMLEEHFKSEGSFPKGRGTNVQVYAFKPYQWRLYGTVCSYEGYTSFLGVKVDPSKKRDKADRAILTAAANALGKYT